MIHVPYFPPDSETPFLMIHIPDGTPLPESTAELVKHCFLILDSELDDVADEINFPGRAIPRLIRSKLAAICSDLERYHWRVYASKLDYCSISITAYGTPK